MAYGLKAPSCDPLKSGIWSIFSHSVSQWPKIDLIPHFNFFCLSCTMYWQTNFLLYHHNIPICPMEGWGGRDKRSHLFYRNSMTNELCANTPLSLAVKILNFLKIHHARIVPHNCNFEMCHNRLVKIVILFKLNKQIWKYFRQHVSFMYNFTRTSRQCSTMFNYTSKMLIFKSFKIHQKQISQKMLSEVAVTELPIAYILNITIKRLASWIRILHTTIQMNRSDLIFLGENENWHFKPPWKEH